MATPPILNPNAVSAHAVRTRLGEILDRVATDKERIFIQSRGKTQAVLIGLEDYFNLIAPAPESLQECWKAAEEAGLNEMSMDEIDAEIDAARREQEAREKALVATQ